MSETLFGPRQLPFDEYVKLEGTNWSLLKHLRVSPLHFQSAKQRADGKDTPARRLGRITHTAIFEPQRLATDYLVYAGDKVKDSKAWKAFQAEHAGRCITTNAELAKAAAIRDAVRAHPLAGRMLEQGTPEACLEWTDGMTGLKLKARVDWLSPRAVNDLKTSKHAIEPRLFAAEAFRLGYFHQSVFYARGARAVLGKPMAPVIVAVETEAPYDCAVYPLAAEAIQLVDEDIDNLLEQLAECQASGKWPGRFDAVQPLDVPRWAFADDEETVVASDDKPNPTWHGR